MAALNKTYWRAAQRRRFEGYSKNGFTGDHVRPTQYSAVAGKFPPLFSSSGVAWSLVDIPNAHPAERSISDFPHARNKSWAKLVNKTRSDPASLGQAVAEFSESFGMIANRATQLYRGYRHLRRGEFRGFLRTFGIGAKRKHRNLVRNSVGQASSLWLEYSFGWKPLTQDIYDACEALQKPVPANPVSGSGAEEYAYDYRTGVGPNLNIWKWRGTAHVKQGADMYVSNPNLYLMQQLGIANPLQVAWELVPFSFLADWAFDISSFLGGWTDLLGLTVLNPYCTFFLKVYGGEQYFNPPSSQQGWIYRITRQTSLSAPVPNVSFLANVGTSMTRAANAVSLLGQILTK